MNCRHFPFTTRSELISDSDYRQGNPYAQQDDVYSAGPYQPTNQRTGYSQIPSGNGGYTGGGAYGGTGYGNENEYEMTQQPANTLNEFFSEVHSNL